NLYQYPRDKSAFSEMSNKNMKDSKLDIQAISDLAEWIGLN
ncbi:16710_t:CDS:1, partial [Funneliformis mosseae]